MESEMVWAREARWTNLVNWVNFFTPTPQHDDDSVVEVSDSINRYQQLNYHNDPL